MSGCKCNQSSNQLLLPKNISRSASQISNVPQPWKNDRVRSGVGLPSITKQLDRFETLGISNVHHSFSDYNNVKQVRACYEIETQSETNCEKCPCPPKIQNTCVLPLPSPAPCCPTPCCHPHKCCADSHCLPPPPPPPLCKLIVCDKFKELSFLDPCDKKKCRWTIKPDECGKNVLVFQCDGKDVALLHCNGDLVLLGAQEATKYCFAPLQDCADKQWCLKTNSDTKSLQFDFEDRNSPLEPDASTTKSIIFTTCGTLIESTSDVSFTADIHCFSFQSDLPASIIAANPLLLLNKTIKIGPGLYNGQKINIVNIDSVEIFVDLNGIVKNLTGEKILTAIWSNAANKWTSN